MIYWSKKYPFSIAFKLYFSEIFAKEKTSRVISSRDASRLSSLCADRRLAKNIRFKQLRF
jgi:hypothetical protein